MMSKKRTTQVQSPEPISPTNSNMHLKKKRRNLEFNMLELVSKSPTTTVVIEKDQVKDVKPFNRESQVLPKLSICNKTTKRMNNKGFSMNNIKDIELKSIATSQGMQSSPMARKLMKLFLVLSIRKQQY